MYYFFSVCTHVHPQAQQTQRSEDVQELAFSFHHVYPGGQLQRIDMLSYLTGIQKSNSVMI